MDVTRLRTDNEGGDERMEEAAREIEQLRIALRRCLEEAEGWMDEARGCKPADVMGYDGWADEARRLLWHNAEVSRGEITHD